MRLVRNAMLALAAIGFAVVAVPSCDDDGSHDDANCDLVVRRCRTVCDNGYSCDYYWGCCYDRCWYECVGSDKPDPAPPSNPAPAPTPSTPPTPAPDAGPAPPGDFAVLCAPCASNDECKGGGLCIIRGGEEAGTTGFCGHPCSSGADCPAEFTCTEIGQSKQCVPTSGNCN